MQVAVGMEMSGRDRIFGALRLVRSGAVIRNGLVKSKSLAGLSWQALQ
jgi:hypothetical protein